MLPLVTRPSGIFRNALHRASTKVYCIKCIKIAGQQKVHDLATAIRDLRTLTSSSVDDPIPVISRPALAIDRLIGVIPAKGAERIHFNLQMAIRRRARPTIGTCGRELHEISLLGWCYNAHSRRGPRASYG